VENLTTDSSRKLLEFLELTLRGSKEGLSGTTELSEATETSETSETSENSEDKPNSETKEGSVESTSEDTETTETSETTEMSETSEDSEKTEDAEMKFFLEKIIAINPTPDEWGPLVRAIDTIMTTRIAKG
jgi:hypothetical protein